MTDHVFVVSEWLPREGCEQKLWEYLKELMRLSAKEEGCIRAHATKQIAHPGSLGKSKFTIVLLQEYVNLKAFDIHCASDYVIKAFEDIVENQETAIVADWQCRLFGEEG